MTVFISYWRDHILAALWLCWMGDKKVIWPASVNTQ